MGAIKDGVVSEKGSALKKYQSAIVGSSSLSLLVRYECTQLFLTRLPGALGLLLRQKLTRAARILRPKAGAWDRCCLSLSQTHQTRRHGCH